MSKPNTYHYFKVRMLNSEHCLEFESLSEFNRFVELQTIKTIFLLLNPAGELTHFAVTHKGGLLQQANQGFKTLEDYSLCTLKKFPDAATFYLAQEQGYSEYQDYLLVKEAGINDKQIFDKLKANGFIDGFKEYEAHLKSLAGVPDIGSPANANQLMEYCTKNGFENFVSFKNAFIKGFKDADTYKIASERGFPTLADYEEGQRKGTLVFADLKFMREHQLRDNTDAKHFVDLEALRESGSTFDERVLVILISKLEQGKKISINKLYDLFEINREEYRYADTKEWPVWYVRNFNDKASVIAFLVKDKAVKKFGTYDSDGEFFEINHMKDRKVVIDGSNVAHNSSGNPNSKPYYTNIIKLVLFLKQKGFTDISVITDASLRHRVVDKDHLGQLKNVAEYLEAPTETPADVFIIQQVKMNHCLLVSNDNFREWKVKDLWVAENIDFYRLSFMIKGDEVMMPDLK